MTKKVQNMIKELEVLADAVHGQKDISRVTMRASVVTAILLDELLSEIKFANRDTSDHRLRTASTTAEFVQTITSGQGEFNAEILRLLRKLAGEDAPAGSEPSDGSGAP